MRARTRAAAAVAVLAAVTWCLLPVSRAEASNTPVRMIVLGDSYSAGVGLGPVSPGCDQDFGTYGMRAYRDILRPHRPMGKIRLAACSGATTQSMTSQINQVDSSFNVAVMTIGGNDVDVFGKVFYCIRHAGCPKDSHLRNLNPYPLPSWNKYVERLTDTYVNVLNQLGPDGHLYVLSYPTPFAGQRHSSCLGFTWNDQIAVNSYSTRLGDRTIDAVNAARARQQSKGANAQIHYVGWRTGNVYPTTTPSGERVRVHWDNSEGLCNTRGNTPLVNGPITSTGISNNSFHPTSAGYWYAARQLAQSIDRYQP